MIYSVRAQTGLPSTLRSAPISDLMNGSVTFLHFSRIFSGPAADAPAPAPTVNATPEPMVKAEPPPDVPQGTHYTDGFLSMIDPVFAPVANITGLHPRDVTDSHIPNLLGNVIMTLAESNLNDFGSLLVSAGSCGANVAIRHIGERPDRYG